MTVHSDLSDDMERGITLLFHENWRERKEGVLRLKEAVARVGADSPTTLVLCERLLDGLSTDAVHARAACHEVLAELGPPALAPLLERIRHRGPATRLLDLLAELGGEDEVALLAELVQDEQADANLRASASTALGSIGGLRAEASLRTLLGESSEMLRTYALDALRVAEAMVPVEELVGPLANPITRKSAVSLLGRSQSLDAVSLLLPLLSDEMAGVRAEAVRSLVRLHDDLVESGDAAAVREAVVQISAATRVRVRDLVAHRDVEVRIAAIRMAAMTGDAEVLHALLDVMDDPRVQECALSLVADLGEAANPVLARAAANVASGTREHLFRLIGAMRVEVIDPRLLTLLVEGLEDPDEETACAGAEALKFVGGRSSMGGLYRAMAIDGRLGEAAADALAQIVLRLGGARRDDLMLLVGASWPQHGALARNLCRVVGQLGSLEYVVQLVSMLGSTDVGVRMAAAQALGHLPGDDEGIGALSFALADEEPQVRAAACRSLGSLGAPQAVQSLLSATADASPLVRAAAVAALVVLDNPVALARFREIVIDDPVPTVVVHAIEGLGAFGSDQDLTMLMSLCTSEDHEVIKAAARALRKFSAHRATAALLGLLDHDRWDVRWAAAEVLADRGDATAVGPLRTVLAREQDELVRDVLCNGIVRLGGFTAESDG